MVFSVSIGEREGITSIQRDRLAWLADHVVTEDGKRGRYRPVELGDRLLVTVNADSAADAQRVVAAVLGRKPTGLTATARDWVPSSAPSDRSSTTGSAPERERSPDRAIAVVGAIIRFRREARGISLRAFARQSNVSPAHLSKIERGHASPGLEVLTRIVNELDLHDADLFGRPVQERARAHVVRAADAPFVPGDNDGEARVAAHTPSATVVLGTGGPEQFPEATISQRQVITVVLAGSLEARIGNDLIQLETGDALIVPAFIARSIRVSGGPATLTACITSGAPQASVPAWEAVLSRSTQSDNPAGTDRNE